jgi:fatty acid desaturase
VLFLIQLLFWTRVSEKINNRMAIALFYSLWCLPLLVALELLPGDASPWSWYAVTIMLIGFPYVHSIMGE